MQQDEIIARIENALESDLLDELEARAASYGMDVEEYAWCDAEVSIYNGDNAFGIVAKIKLWLTTQGRESEFGDYFDAATAGNYETLKAVSRGILLASTPFR